ncbi:sulfite exporter TauE/SafE family protein [Geomicrobium sp. JCM 19055]|uniref:sulfite exporter TauE/SafE family protein n=1 Tax=Geomicrobium sp. JCM 19055 TaxID=1460649 RepID=UPI00045ED0E8|nr:sulfite exporter TauE/SafE family protein [Geomicrobium sp. JCM 19055]GAJ98141.1 hypothetical protein JCM19055_1046 [Geomicrobium sp. JCM 19055]
MLAILLFTLIGIFIGIMSSLFGFGGGFIVVPILYAFLPESIPHAYLMHTAIGTSLAVMIVNSFNSTLNHAKQGNVHWPVFHYLAIFIAIGSLFGAVAASFIESEWLRYAFIGFLLYVIVSNIIKKTFTTAITDSHFRFPKRQYAGANGVCIGWISSMLGIGGSVMTIPYLRKRGLNMLHAVALATPLGLPIAIVGTTTYMILGANVSGMPASTLGFIYIPALIGFTIGGFAGVPIGRRIAQVLPDKIFSKAYLVLLAIVVVFMIVG